MPALAFSAVPGSSHVLADPTTVLFQCGAIPGPSTSSVPSGRHNAEISDTVRIEQEKEADNFALAFLVDGQASESERLISGAALVMLTCSNLFLTAEFPQLWKQRHPHTHDRIRNAISGLNLTSEKTKYYLYHLAATGLREFLESKQLESSAPVEETAEDLFHWYLDRYDQLLIHLGSGLPTSSS